MSHELISSEVSVKYYSNEKNIVFLIFRPSFEDLRDSLQAAIIHEDKIAQRILMNEVSLRHSFKFCARGSENIRTMMTVTTTMTMTTSMTTMIQVTFH